MINEKLAFLIAFVVLALFIVAQSPKLFKVLKGKPKEEATPEPVKTVAVFQAQSVKEEKTPIKVLTKKAGRPAKAKKPTAKKTVVKKATKTAKTAAKRKAGRPRKKTV